MGRKKIINEYEELLDRLSINSLVDLQYNKKLKKKLAKLVRLLSPQLSYRIMHDLKILRFMVRGKATPAKKLLNSVKTAPSFKPGIYGWFFKVPSLLYVPKKGCEIITTGRWPFRRYWTLLYVGKASNLFERVVKQHVLGKLVRGKAQSSLRQSLGCLLCNKLKLCLYKYRDFPNKEYTFGKKGERRLTIWILDNAMVDWFETEDIVQMEDAIIQFYTLPLNTKNNCHWFSNGRTSPLSTLKKDLRDCAPYLRKRPPKDKVREAYDRFVESVQHFINEEETLA